VLEHLGITRKKVWHFRQADGSELARSTGYAIVHAAGTETNDEVVFGEYGDLVLLGARSLEGLNLRVEPVTKRLVDAGPAHTPDDRPYIERFFGSIAANLSSRLPGYTGSNARDLRRALADPKGNLRLYGSLDEIEELLEAALAAYNATPHDGLNGRTPLEAVEHAVHNRGAMLDWLPEGKRRTLCLMHTPRRATVRGYLAQGQRPHVNFLGVRYTSPLLASTAAFLGQEVRLYYNSQDLRTVRVFAADGGEIGVLKAQGAWGEIVHDLKLRQEIVRLRGRKRLDGAIDHDFLQRFVDGKLAKAKRSRRAASEVAHTIRTLAAAPISTSALSPAKDSAARTGSRSAWSARPHGSASSRSPARRTRSDEAMIGHAPRIRVGDGPGVRGRRLS